MALNLRNVLPIDLQFTTETHGKTRNIHNDIDIFRVIRCDSVAIDQYQGFSK